MHYLFISTEEIYFVAEKFNRITEGEFDKRLQRLELEQIHRRGSE